MQVAQMQMRSLSRSALPRAAASSFRSSAGRLTCCGTGCGLLRTPHSTACGSFVESRRRASSSSDAAASSSEDDKTKLTVDASKVEKTDGTAAAASNATSAETPLDPEAAAAARQAARDAIIHEILSRDKVIFELKRQHELSMLRVEQNQSRVLKDQEDRGMYYEQNSNVHTFDTISVGLYSQRSTLYHTLSAERLRNVKIFLMVFTTLMTCVYFYYRYIINPDWAYVEKPMNVIGSRVQAVREQRWRMLSTEERFEEMRKKDKAYSAQNE